MHSFTQDELLAASLMPVTVRRRAIPGTSAPEAPPRAPQQAPSKQPRPTYRWMTDGKAVVRFAPEDVERQLAAGWRLGRIAKPAE